MTLEREQDRIVEEFAALGDWLDKYEYLVRLGRAHLVRGADLRSGHNALSGCQARVWIRAERDGETLRFDADSDSLIIRGILSLLLRVLNGHAPQTIAQADLYFLDRVGLSNGLSPSRANGVATIVAAIKRIAAQSE